MRRHVSLVVSAFAAVFVLTAIPWVGTTLFNPEPSTSPSVTSAGAHLQANYAKLPLGFFPNAGQMDERVKFTSGGAGYQLFVTPTEAVLSLHRRSAPRVLDPGDISSTDAAEPAPTVLRLQWVGANPAAKVAGLQELPGKVNYLLGNDPARWRTDLPTYARVELDGVWPGVDLVYYGNQGCLEYDLVVAPGADPAPIKLAIHGADRVALDDRGDLVLHTPQGTIHQRRPYIYQEVDGERREIDGGYALAEGNLVTFKLGAYDASTQLVIDPVLSFSTYLGGTGVDASSAVVDDGGSLYVAGRTQSTNFPTLAPDPEDPVQTVLGGPPGADTDVFIAKLTSSGSALVYSTYLGGSGIDQPFGLVTDGAGNVIVAGTTASSNFPTLAPLQGARSGAVDLFVAKLNATGSALAYSTYLGGAGLEGSNVVGSGIYAQGHLATDNAGRAFVTSQTTSLDFPTTPNAYSSTLQGTVDACVVVLNPSGSAVEYGTYFGGSFADRGVGIRVDAAGDIYIGGSTSSPDLPTAPATPLDATLGGLADAFAAKFHITAAATTLVYSTYLGGSSTEGVIVPFNGCRLAVDAAGRAHVTTLTLSTDFPVFNAAQPVHGSPGGIFDVAVVKLNAAGTAFEYATYLGGAASDIPFGIAVDTDGFAYVTGSTFSANFPVTNPLQPVLSGSQDAFVARFSPSGALVFSTYFGGSLNETGFAIAADAFSNAYVVGLTASTNFPTVDPIQGTLAGGVLADAFISKISFAVPGNIAGHVVADCPAPGTPLLGVTVDAFAVGSGTLIGTGVTDAGGNYLIPNIPATTYTVTLVFPLGYSTPASEVAATVISNQTTSVDFALNCIAASGVPRSSGFWKHQVGVATGGNGTAQIDAATLCSQLDMIEGHFNSNALNQVVVYDASASATCAEKLEIAKGLLNLAGSAAMIDRARQQLLSLLLNVAANKLRLTDVVSSDGATVSQAITFCDNLIDNAAGNHELAKDIADRINNGQHVAAGKIPLSTQMIAYGRRPVGPGGEGDELPGAGLIEFQVSPNPGASVRTFSFVVEREGPVGLAIYDVAGRRIADVYAGVLQAGRHTIHWGATRRDGGTLGRGSYLARLTTPSATRTVKLIQMER